MARQVETRGESHPSPQPLAPRNEYVCRAAVGYQTTRDPKQFGHAFQPKIMCRKHQHHRVIVNAQPLSHALSVDFAVYGKSKYGLFNPSVEVTFFLAIRLLHDSQIPNFTILLSPSWVPIQLAC